MISLKNIVLALTFFVLLPACKQAPKISVIKGKVENCEGCKVELTFYDYAQLGVNNISETQVDQGQFLLLDTLRQAGVYDLTLRDPKAGGTHIVSKIYLPADTVSLIINPKKKAGSKVYRFPLGSSGLKFATIRSTSPEQEPLNEYLMRKDSMEQKFQNDQALTTAFFSQAIERGKKAEIDKWGDSVNLFSARYGSYQAKAADVFLQKYPQSEIVYFAMLDNRDNMGAANRFRKFYQTLTPEQQTSYYGKILDKRLARWEKRNKNSQRFVGTSITYLAGKTPTGQKVDAGKIFKQNKLTLVEFWASWCDSCRMRTPNYQQLYQNYHPKGFDIIAVSLDDDRNDWRKAIAQDKLPWHHVSELQGNKGDIMRFRLTGIPANLLLNEKGEIVAVDITPDKLKDKLSKSCKAWFY